MGGQSAATLEHMQQRVAVTRDIDGGELVLSLLRLLAPVRAVHGVGGCCPFMRLPVIYNLANLDPATLCRGDTKMPHEIRGLCSLKYCWPAKRSLLHRADHT